MKDNKTRPARTLVGIAVFLLVAFGVPWAGWIVFRSARSPGAMIEALALFWLPAACSVAGFVASLAEGGLGGLRAFSARVLSPRFRWYLFPLALSLPLAAGALTFSTHPGDLARGGTPRLALLGGAATFLANLWTGPVAEEFGWRGYLLPKFAERWSPVAAGLVIGVIWALWHLPLFYDSAFADVPSAVKFLATTAAWSVTLALLIIRARGSVLPAIACHWAINSQVIIFHALLPQVARERLPGGWGFCAASVAVAAILAWFWRDVRWVPRT
jgi:CAAX protease family protein